MARLTNLALILFVVLAIAAQVLEAATTKSASKTKAVCTWVKGRKRCKNVYVKQPAKKPASKPSTTKPVTTPATKPATTTSGPKPPPNDKRNVCKSFTERFNNPRIVDAHDFNGDKYASDWINLSGTRDVYAVRDGKLQINLLKPKQYERVDSDQGPYNKYGGTGATLNSTLMMHYGQVDVKMKTNGVGGVVTAFICMSPEGDEIDWEAVGKDTTHIQTNYYYNREIIWGVNGGVHPVGPPGIAAAVHTYTINWTPDVITWSVDGNVVRTLRREDTFKDGVYKYPYRPSHIQFGIWDGSTAPGTAHWANGPIDWDKQPAMLSTEIEEITIKCDPKYNYDLSTGK